MRTIKIQLTYTTDSKKCSRCRQICPKTLFASNKSRVDGLQAYCRACCGITSKRWTKTYNGRLSRMYTGIKDRSKRYERLVTFTREQFYAWVDHVAYAELYRKWASNNYQQSLSPSVDRIDNSKGYHLWNIQLMSIGDNISKDQSGEMNNSAKLTAQDARLIKRLYASGEYTQEALANRFGVTTGAIRPVLAGKTWQTKCAVDINQE